MSDDLQAQAQRDELVAKRDMVFRSISLPDLAAAHSTAVARQRGLRTDAALTRCMALTARIEALDFCIARAGAPKQGRASRALPDVQPGDRIVVWTGNVLSVVKVSRKSVITAGGSRWVADEIDAVITGGGAS